MNYCIQRNQEKDQCFFIFKNNNNLLVDGEGFESWMSLLKITWSVNWVTRLIIND